MTTATLPRPNYKPVLLLLAALIALSGMYAAVTAPRHAVEVHGMIAVTAANCFNGYGQVSTTQYVNPQNGRRASICDLLGSMFVMIQEQNGDLVTMFKNKRHGFERVAEYLRGRGYVEIVP